MEFKIGDKVKILSEPVCSEHDNKTALEMYASKGDRIKRSSIGYEGIIDKIEIDPFDNVTPLYRVSGLPKKCFPKSRKDKYWWYRADQLELVRDKPEPKFMIGDKVKAVKCNYSPHVGKVGEVVGIRKDVRINESLIYKLIYDIKFPDGTVYGTINQDGEEFELVEAEEPKIEAVVKCKQSHDTIKKDNYYAVIPGSWTWVAYLIKGHEGLWNADLFEKPFKVGDRFKYEKCGFFSKPLQAKIIGLYSDYKNNIYVEYQYDDNSTGYNDIEFFDKHFTKIEDEPEKKEPKPKFHIGQLVEIISGSFAGRKGNISLVSHDDTGFKYCIDDFRPQINECINGIYEKDLKLIDEPELLPVGTRVKVILMGCACNAIQIGDECEIINVATKDDLTYRIRATNGNEHWVYPREIEKINKSEWQPKFKVGDWVHMKEALSNIVKIAVIYNNHSCYGYVFPNGVKGHAPIHENKLQLWQPMQDLKLTIADLEDELAMEKSKTNGIPYETKLLIKQIELDRVLLDDEYIKNEELKETIRKLESDNELLKGNNQWMNREIDCKRTEVERLRGQLELQLKDIEKLVEAIAQLKSGRSMV